MGGEFPGMLRSLHTRSAVVVPNCSVIATDVDVTLFAHRYTSLRAVVLVPHVWIVDVLVLTERAMGRPLVAPLNKDRLYVATLPSEYLVS